MITILRNIVFITVIIKNVLFNGKTSGYNISFFDNIGTVFFTKKMSEKKSKKSLNVTNETSNNTRSKRTLREA